MVEIEKSKILSIEVKEEPIETNFDISLDEWTHGENKDFHCNNCSLQFGSKVYRFD